jgi:hypothetical protein
MKTGLLLLILCCYSEDKGVYKYETKNLKDTTQTGTLWSAQKYIEGDTVKM